MVKIYFKNRLSSTCVRNIAIYHGEKYKYPIPYFSFERLRLVHDDSSCSLSFSPTMIPLADIITGYEANGWSTLNETARPLTYHRERLVELVHRRRKGSNRRILQRET